MAKSGDYSNFFDTMVKIGLPHYDSNPNCWCKPVVIYFQVDMNRPAWTAIVHNYENPISDKEIHDTFRYILMADDMFDD